MNICGCLVHALPARQAAIRAVLEETDGVEVHAESDDGRLVVVVEDTARRLASETIMDMHQLPGIVSITLTYHHFEDLSAPRARTSSPDTTTAGGPLHDHL